MTAPRFVACRCTHAKADHEQEGFAPQCTASGCTCLRYRPITAEAPRPATVPTGLAHTPAPVVVPSGALNIDALLRTGKASSHKNIVKLTERIGVLLHDLRSRIEDERHATAERTAASAAKQAARDRVERLTAELAAAKAELRGGQAPPQKVKDRSGGSLSCPDCEDTFGSPQGLGAHRARKHGYRRPA